MNTLHEFQKQFTDNLLNEDINTLFLKQFKSSSEKQKCFSVYRNNTLHSLSEALGDTYPIVKRLIGDASFKQIALDFIRHNPPAAPSLSDYGRDFSHFLKTSTLNNTLPYLSDVALLEWYYQCAFHSSDQPTLNLNALQSISAEQLHQIRLTPLASVNLLSSAFPIDVIWEENLKDDIEIIDLNQLTPAYLLIYRPQLEVAIISLQSNTFKLLQGLCQGDTLEVAWKNTTIPIQELSNQLAYLLNLRIFSSYTIDINER